MSDDSTHPEGVRFFPTSFDPENPSLTGFPRPLEWRWRSCELLLRECGARSVMSHLPLFWQTEAPLGAACREANAYYFVSNPKNMPVGSAAMRALDIDTIVSEPADASAFAAYLAERGIPLPRGWILVHDAAHAEWRIPDALAGADWIGQEVHLFPGVPVLQQCPALAREKRSVFRLSDDYEWEFDGSRAFITSTGSDIAPLSRFELPCTLREHGTCPYGKPAFERDV